MVTSEKFREIETRVQRVFRRVILLSQTHTVADLNLLVRDQSSWTRTHWGKNYLGFDMKIWILSREFRDVNFWQIIFSNCEFCQQWWILDMWIMLELLKCDFFFDKICIFVSVCSLAHPKKTEAFPSSHYCKNALRGTPDL